MPQAPIQESFRSAEEDEATLGLLNFNSVAHGACSHPPQVDRWVVVHSTIVEELIIRSEFLLPFFVSSLFFLYLGSGGEVMWADASDVEG